MIELQLWSRARPRKEDWICNTTIQEVGYEEEGSLIPRGRETVDKIQGPKLQDNEVSTSNMTIQVLVYTCPKWIVDPNPIKVQLEWHMYSWKYIAT